MTRRNSYGEEQEPTEADLLRWAREDDRDYGFNGYDEGYPVVDRSRHPAVRAHVFAECTKVGCITCATR